MQFIKLEERDRDRSIEYYIRTDLIREIYVEKNEQGKITLWTIFQMRDNSEQYEGTEYSFKDEYAERNYSNISAFISSVTS
jgi:hypothetical protein